MSDSIARYRDLFEADTKTVGFKLEMLILGITHSIDEAMRSRGMSRADLARRLDVTPPMVTKILNGTSNFTLKTLVSVSDALDCEFTAAMAPCGYRVHVEFVAPTSSFAVNNRSSFLPRVDTCGRVATEFTGSTPLPSMDDVRAYLPYFKILLKVPHYGKAA